MAEMFVHHRSSGREVYSWLLSAVVMYGEMVMIQSDWGCWCWLQSIRASISLRHVCFCRRSDDRRRSDTSHPLSHHHHHHCCFKYNSLTHSRHTNTGWGTVHTWLHRYALHSVWTDLNPLNGVTDPLQQTLAVSFFNIYRVSYAYYQAF